MASFEYGPNATNCELTSGAQTALIGFRAIPHGHIQCCTVHTYFKTHFDAETRTALNHLTAFVSLLLMYGQRKIWLSCPASRNIKPDELCILSTLEAAQSNASYQLTAQLTWLLGTPPPKTILNAARNIGEIFSKANLTIASPDINVPDVPIHSGFTKIKRRIGLKVL